MEIICTGCSKGISYCYHRPCWGTPEEFNNILDAGFAGKIQLDWWHRRASGGEDIPLLTGAVHQEIGADSDVLSLLMENFGLSDKKIPRSEREYEEEHTGGKTANLNPLGKCALLTLDNKCSLHNLGLKPEEGRTSCCKLSEEDYKHEKTHEQFASLWNTDYGRTIISKWKQLTNFENEEIF